MNIEIVKNEKNDVELLIDNTTIAEVLRAYLYEVGADFAAWRREHLSKSAVLRVKCSSKTSIKAIKDAIAAIERDCDSLLKLVKGK